MWLTFQITIDGLHFIWINQAVLEWKSKLDMLKYLRKRRKRVKKNQKTTKFPLPPSGVPNLQIHLIKRPLSLCKRRNLQGKQQLQLRRERRTRLLFFSNSPWIWTQMRSSETTMTIPTIHSFRFIHYKKILHVFLLLSPFPQFHSIFSLLYLVNRRGSRRKNWRFTWWMLPLKCSAPLSPP